jgi:hypothetical protein
MKDSRTPGKTIECRLAYALDEMVNINSMFSAMRATNKAIKNILRRLH